MALSKIKALYLGLALTLLLIEAECSPFRARRVLTEGVETVFDVTTFGAKPDGNTDNSLVSTIKLISK